MILNFIVKYRQTVLYGVSLAVLLVLERWLQLRLVVFSHALEVYIGAIALIFTGLGIWLALKLMNHKMRIEQPLITNDPLIEKNKEFELHQQMLLKLGISKRELEVLQLMAAGLSNQEIALQLFVSLNTIKTHSSKLFEKLDVNRRTQAIEKARRLSLIP